MNPGLIESLVPLVAVIMGTLIVLIPVAGLTVRFAIKPITEAMARVREAPGAGRELSILEQRVALLEQQVQNIESSVDRIGAARDFDRQLGSGQG
jgi:hypothetical protein